MRTILKRSTKIQQAIFKKRTTIRTNPHESTQIRIDIRTNPNKSARIYTNLHESTQSRFKALQALFLADIAHYNYKSSCGLSKGLKWACTHAQFFKWGSLIPLKVHFRELRPSPSKLGKSTFVCTKVQLAILCALGNRLGLSRVQTWLLCQWLMGLHLTVALLPCCRHRHCQDKDRWFLDIPLTLQWLMVH